ncbi:hypothetical protein MNBD_GAMMA11-1858 [hydrothermal vent metagenome]|uniref:Uncharacterized protein n=1 Tax=hydrothermal vent metagenome TaxID=652676 RepID=A0A3B0XBD1_9ZZZZ
MVSIQLETEAELEQHPDVLERQKQETLERWEVYQQTVECISHDDMADFLKSREK